MEGPGSLVQGGCALKVRWAVDSYGRSAVLTLGVAGASVLVCPWVVGPESRGKGCVRRA